jgi:non-ribosomal peptide synthetase component F
VLPLTISQWLRALAAVTLTLLVLIRGEPMNDGTVTELFAQRVLSAPDATALRFLGEETTYRQLDLRAEHLAHRLRAVGVGPETVVGVCVERSFEMIVALVGVLRRARRICRCTRTSPPYDCGSCSTRRTPASCSPTNPFSCPTSA